jgi:hypothetical protein
LKTKDLVMILVAAGIFLVCVYVGYTQLVPKKSSSSGSQTVQVEVIGSIPSSMDASGVSALNDTTKVQDFDTPINLTGLGNSSPFGQ